MKIISLAILRRYLTILELFLINLPKQTSILKCTRGIHGLKVRFNYIITIHNKADLIEQVLEGIIQSAKENDAVFPVLDGCTDQSEEIVDRFIREHRFLKWKKIILDDVHEIRSINSALALITDGFTICLQDDVVLEEKDLQRKVIELYQTQSNKLGIISFCRAANIRRVPLLRQFWQSGLTPLIEETDLIVAKHDFCPTFDRSCETEVFTPRMVAIKSPVCIPFEVVKAIGILDDGLAPFSWDDHEYCVRALKAGFVNGLFPLQFKSEIAWGGTRRDPAFVKKARIIHLRNRRFIWQKHGSFISTFTSYS